MAKDTVVNSATLCGLLLLGMASGLIACGGEADGSLQLTDPGVSLDDAYNIPAIADAGTANCAFSGQSTTSIGGIGITQWNVSYQSWEYINGVGLTPITITGVAARPTAATGAGSIPGVVFAHGLGGSADQAGASQLAARLDAYVLMYNGPGVGSSEGQPYITGLNTYRIFDALQSLQGSWFWAHSVAAMRGLTCLAERFETDDRRLGMTGGSAGAIATLLSAAVDPRLVAAVPVSGSFGLDLAVQSADAWEHALLTLAGLDTGSREWTILTGSLLDPGVLTNSGAAVMMINGSSDEYFPLSAWQATVEQLPTPRRTAVIANFDHGCFDVNPVEDAGAIGARADTRIGGGTDMWFGYWFGNDAAYTQLPAAPIMETLAAGGTTTVNAVVDLAGGAYDIAGVTFWWSEDDAWSFQSLALSDNGGGNYSASLPAALPAGAAAFVDVLYNTGETVPRSFSLSSNVLLPEGFVADIRPYASCI